MYYGGLQCFGQLHQLRMSSGAATSTEQRSSAVIQESGKRIQFGIFRQDRRSRRPNRRRERRSLGYGHETHIPWQNDDRNTALRNRNPYGRLEHARQLVGTGYKLTEMAALLKQVLWVGLLEVVSSDLSDRDLRSNGEDRNPAALAVEQSVDQVQIPWTARAGANCQLTSQRGIGSGSEGGCLLVPRVHPGDVTASTQSFGQTVEAITDDAVDTFDPYLIQSIGNEISNFLIHHELSL